MATEKPRYSITLDDEMFKEIEDFRFEQRYPNRNQATIELIRLGLEAMKKQQEEQKKAQKISPPARRLNKQSSHGENARPPGV